MPRKIVEGDPFEPKTRRTTVSELDLSFSKTDAQLAARAILRMAASARTDLSEFYSLVIRHETTKERLKAAPHQELQFSFIIHHERAVNRQPIGTGKTFGMAAAALWLIGKDVTQRGAIISKTQQQSQKPLTMVSDYITEPSLNKVLSLVFPNLRKSQRPTDRWTQTEITVDRPPGIRDPSIIAKGLDGAIGGARLSWIVGDDMVDLDNSLTPEGREKTKVNFESRIMSRLDPMGSRAIVTNTPWDREDLTYYLEREAGWPTLQMDIYGFIKIENADASWVAMAEQVYIRPSTTRPGYYRLRAHDPDPREETPLWPDRYSASRIAEIRYGKNGRGGALPHEFARLFLCEPFDADAARCNREWVERCKRRGIGTTLVHQYNGEHPTFTGVDVAIGTGHKNDSTVFFTIELLPDGSRRILDIDGGKWSGPEIVRKLIDKAKRYRSVIAVESVQAQDYIRQFALEERKDLIVKPHPTRAENKHNKDFGVESVFTELSNGAWIIPCDANGVCDQQVQNWIDGMLYYQPPPAHTSDYLMASWIARERARKSGHSDPTPARKQQSPWATQRGF